MIKKVSGIYIAVIAGVLLLLGVGSYSLLSRDGIEPNDKPDIVQGDTPKSVTKAGKITYQGVDGITVLDLLKSLHNTVTKTASYGEYVVSIDGVDGSGPKYWLYYVNDKQAEVGAGAFQSKASDNIEWRLE